MLYDPRWEAKTEEKPDLQHQGVTLRGFISWLETMPPDVEYDFTEAHSCAVAQYRAFQGHTGEAVLVDFDIDITDDVPGSWLCKIVNRYPWTFGAALERARKLAPPHA